MTFNDGTISVYTIENIASAGDKPKEGLIYNGFFFFGYATLGINRYYTALQAHQQIESVINIPEHNRFEVEKTVVIMEDDTQFRVMMCQTFEEEDGFRYTTLSLERITEDYDIADTDY